jgi:aryl carrier-like protein
MKSTEKERAKMAPNSALLKRPFASPKNLNSAKRPISELGNLKSPLKVGKNLSPKETPLGEKEGLMDQGENSTLDSKEPEKLYLQFSKNTLSDFFDLSDCNLESDRLVEYVHRARRIHKIRGLKICNNRLTTAGFEKMTEYLQGVSNINAGNNDLNELIFEVILRHKERLDSLRMLTLAHNPVSMDKKAAARLEEVRRLGIIVTL